MQKKFWNSYAPIGQLKRSLAVILTVALVSAFLPFGTASAVGTTAIEDKGADGYYYYTLYDTYAEITSYVQGSKTTVAIPDTLGGKPVTSIYSMVNSDWLSQTTVTIPSSVTSINTSANGAAFSGENLTAINVDTENASYMSNDGILYNKDGTTLIQCPKAKESSNCSILSTVTTISDNAFKQCTGLTGTLTIPKGVQTIGKSSFFGCTGLTSITFEPESALATVGWGAFWQCTEISSITIPSSVTSIGNYSFSECSKLTAINVDSGNTAYTSADDVLYDYDKTTLVAYPCAKTGPFTVPNSVTDLRYGAFKGYAGLTGITIAAGTKIMDNGYYGDSPLFDCVNLTSVTIPNDNTYCKSTDGVVYSKNGTTLLLCPRGKTGTFTIPDTVTTIGKQAFENCKNLTGVTIGSAVTTIADEAFDNCSGLTGAITIPASVTSIGFYSFGDCTGLTGITFEAGSQPATIGQFAFGGCTNLIGTITIPASITTIGQQAFNDCKKITEVSIPATVTSLDAGAFCGCEKLTAINVDPDNTTYQSADGVVYSEDGTSIVLVPEGKTGALTVLNTVTKIGTELFSYNPYNGITSIAIPESVTSIKMDSIMNMPNLATITVAANNANYKSNSDGDILYTKDGKTLLWCSRVKTGPVTIPDTVEMISSSAFSGCARLTGISVPASVKTIYWNAFSSCSALESVTFAENMQLESIPGEAFRNCSSLKTFSIPSSVKTIGEYAFYGCTSLTDISIPSSVNTIGQYAFYGCTGLTTITVPASVSTVGLGAFVKCTGLQTVDYGGTQTQYAKLVNMPQNGVNGVTVTCVTANITLNPTTLTLAAGGTGNLAAVVSPATIVDTAVDWSSADSGVATVDASGKVTGVGAGTTVITAAAHADSTKTASCAVTVTAANSGNSGSGGYVPSTPTTGNKAEPVIVDGTEHDIGTKTTTDTTTTVTVDNDKLQEQLESASDSVVVPITSKTDTTVAQLVVKNVEDMAKKDMTLSVDIGKVQYNIPSTAVQTDEVMRALGATDPAQVPVNVTITQLKNEDVTIKNGTLQVPPVQFTVTASYGGKTVETSVFTQYVSRVIELPESTDLSKITTAVVKEPDGAERHVPTFVSTKDGKDYAKINSLTNSTYALIYNQASFADAAGKWYENIVSEMASREILMGRDTGVFDGDASITRAEFAAVLVRALGLPASGTSSFTDVASTDWYAGAVGTASSYGLVLGYEDGSFGPNNNITRQEAMAMIARAAKVAEYAGKTSELTAFSDAASVSSWAISAAQYNVGSGLIVGDNGQLRPNDAITRAESATVVLRLLQKAGLVDVRSAT